jgi:MSHA biogenesis protein MshQ
VRPFAFDVQVAANNGTANPTANPAASDAFGDKFIAAGSPMTVTTRAVAWASGNDLFINGTDVAGNDGIPDIGVDISVNPTTTNFIVNNATLTPGLVAPSGSSGGSLGSLSATFSGNFTAGENSFETSYSEVGIIALIVNVNNYLAAGINITGEVPFVGRFIPAYFKQTVNSNGQLKGEHFNGFCEDENWVYTGQKTVGGAAYVSTDTKGAIRYSIPPIIDITAYNQDGSITENYTSAGFMKLNGLTDSDLIAEIIITPPTADDVETSQSLTASMSLGADPVEKEIIDPDDNTQTIAVKGVVSYTFNDADNYFYNHISSAKVAEFDAKIPFFVNSIKDNDGVMLPTPLSDSTKKVLSEGVAIRFGRWHIENGYGPETSDLNVSMQIQYFDGTDFVTNDLENCTLPAQGNRNNDSINSGNMDATYDYRLQKSNNNADENIDASDIEQLLLPLNPGTEPSQFYQGLYRFLSFSAVSSVLVDKRGSLDFEYQVPPWLQYDWNGNSDNDDAFDQNPTATITFGLFRGNDRIIYQREIE